MLFPTSGIECNPLLPFLVAMSVSFLTSMGGVSGAFLLLPFQVSVLGYTAPGVSATNQVFNLLACPAGVLRFWREGRLVWPLVLVMAVGTLPGVFIGAWIRVAWLPDPSTFKVFAGLVMLWIGGRMLKNMFTSRKAARANTGERCHVTKFTLHKLHFTFQDEEYSVSCKRLAQLCLAVGLVGGIYGIGGGAILSPFLIAVFGLPVYAIAGATLCTTFVTSIAGVSFYHVIAPWYPNMSVAPDWTLGLLLGLGGMAGAYLGAKCQVKVPAFCIKAMLVGVALFTAYTYLVR